MIGHFLTPMADKGARGHRNINTNQPARVRGKIHRRFPSPPISTGVQLICNGNSKDRCSRQRCENCDSLSGTPLCSVRLLHISVLQSFRSSVVVFKASSCILRHHSTAFFFAHSLLQCQCLEKICIIFKRSSRYAFRRMASFSSLLLPSPQVFLSSLGSVYFVLLFRG